MPSATLTVTYENDAKTMAKIGPIGLNPKMIPETSA